MSDQHRGLSQLRRGEKFRASEVRREAGRGRTTTAAFKRKKSTVEMLQSEASSRDTEKRLQPTLFPPFSCPRSVVHAAAWWNGEQLPAVESLWAFTLRSSLSYLEEQHWDPVPDLPLPAALGPAALQFADQRGCDLREEVAPLPEPAPPSPRTMSSPDPLRLGSSQQYLSVQTEPAPHTSDTLLSSHGRQRHDGRTASLTKRQWVPPLSREEAVSLARYSSVGGREQVEEAGPFKRQLLTNQVKDSKDKGEVVKEKDEELGSVRGDVGAVAGGGRLQSCPMCLLVFPVGSNFAQMRHDYAGCQLPTQSNQFTQMDCDGHLAQCLSQRNVDVTCRVQIHGKAPSNASEKRIRLGDLCQNS
ncbi:hypothetical protein F2P81_011897 [Scophthalmus maximus]|uniref:UBZ2-type domain-containing protein n=1 Tax=Scophthalmus maximus TaxID=52904 RepID=A0A6A4SV73_SCOMX|nr:hypothetical protein F2P81_011897 [Scophthalmus maximus]